MSTSMVIMVLVFRATSMFPANFLVAPFTLGWNRTPAIFAAPGLCHCLPQSRAWKLWQNPESGFRGILSAAKNLFFPIRLGHIDNK